MSQNVVREKEGTHLRRRRRRKWKGSCGGKMGEERERGGLWI